jgi:uncharacterized protein YqeY
MTLQEQITTDMGTSMKGGDGRRTGVLRLLRAAFKNDAIKIGRDLTEEEAQKVLQREAKQRRDSIAAYAAAGRDDLVVIEQAELDIIAEYLPAALSDDELLRIVEDVILAQGASDMKAMGAVIGAVMAQVGARAEGGKVSALVRERLGA